MKNANRSGNASQFAYRGSLSEAYRRDDDWPNSMIAKDQRRSLDSDLSDDEMEECSMTEKNHRRA